MIYDSFHGRTWGTERFPLLTFDQKFIYLGGHADPEKAGLSPLDIERVAALYPKQHAEQVANQARNANHTQAKQPTLEVVIPGLFTTIVSPVPTGFPKSRNDSQAIEIANRYAADCGRRCSGTFIS